MRLDMISRRRFLKSAGAAALAVAAAGVLAGCDGGDSSSKVPGTEVPDVPGTTSKQVKIIFADVDNGGAGIGNGGDYYEHPVLKDATVVDPKSIPADKLPKGYELADTTPVTIFEAPNGYDYVVVSVKKIVVTPTTKDVIVQLRGADGKKFNVTATVAKDAKGVKPSQVPMPEGYEFYPGMYDANTEYPFSTEGTDPDHDFFFMIQKKV